VKWQAADDMPVIMKYLLKLSNLKGVYNWTSNKCNLDNKMLVCKMWGVE